ncbi:MAG: fumarylacetoacetate hydrolase family protein [Actinomycetota bacterium]
MTTQLIRFVNSQGQTSIGVQNLELDVTHPVLVNSIAELLTHPLTKIRELIDGALTNSENSTVVRLLPPVDELTEVWAAGVTYKRSRAAREEESDHADVYSRVYDAERPELFFKSVAWRVTGTNEPVAVRTDSTINTPEPELALVCNSAGEIIGLTICDDVSSRSIEGENPLYLPQAKIYSGSCAVGPGIVPIWSISDLYALDISVAVERSGKIVWQGTTSTSEMHRRFEDLVEYLFLQMKFPEGVILSTGTGLVPSIEFNLAPLDTVTVEISHVGKLVNPVISAGSGSFDWLTPEPARIY